MEHRPQFTDLIPADVRAALAAMPEDERQRFKRALAVRLARRELPVAPTPPPPAP